MVNLSQEQLLNVVLESQVDAIHSFLLFLCFPVRFLIYLLGRLLLFLVSLGSLSSSSSVLDLSKQRGFLMLFLLVYRLHSLLSAGICVLERGKFFLVRPQCFQLEERGVRSTPTPPPPPI